MCKNLYFIPILSQALVGTNLDESVAKAFAEIKQRGQESQFMEGFQNFESFMALACSHRDHLNAANHLELTASSPSEKADASFEIGLIRENQLIATKHIYSLPGRASFEDVSPGQYQAMLIDTGWVIWSQKIVAEDVIVSDARRHKNLEMAAETEDVERQESPKTVLFNGNVILRILPGIESGTIDIECLG